MPQVHKIVLTGGPCGGKTIGAPVLKKFLEVKGWKVFTVPETATLLSANGIELGCPAPEMKLAVQTAILKLQITLEDGMEAAAKASGKDCVIICDRGLMDSKVYTPADVWLPHLERNELSELRIRGRYDAVFHMMSAAVGAPDHYNYDNPARWENFDQAVINDRKTQDAWIGHQHLRIIDNSTGFDEKLQRLCNLVEHFVAPDHKEIERRFLIDTEDINLVELNRTLLPIVTLNIAQTYLKTTDGTVARFRQTGENYNGVSGSNHVVWHHTVKYPKVGASCTEIERRITSEEFNSMKFEKDENRQIIFKKRHCFLWNDKQFQLDEFETPIKGTLILEIELDNENEEFTIPPFLSVIKEVTTDSSYSNWNIANVGNNALAANK